MSKIFLSKALQLEGTETGRKLAESFEEQFPGINIKPLSAFSSRKTRWLVEGFFPRGEINILGGDGGVGKSQLTANVGAAVSSGRPCIFDPPDIRREKGLVVISCPEDAVREVLFNRFEIYGADLDNIIILEKPLTLTSEDLHKVIRDLKPVLLIIDPLQSHLPDGINMASRSDMRCVFDSLRPVVRETNTTVIIIVHNNKMQGVSGRSHLGDSSDIWDASRSVTMVGETKKRGTFYATLEKTNYGAKDKYGFLYKIDAKGVHKIGNTMLKEADFRNERLKNYAPATEPCAEDIIKLLTEKNPEPIYNSELQDTIVAIGHTKTAYRKAKNLLYRDGRIIVEREKEYEGAFLVRLAQRPRLSERDSEKTSI